MIIVVWVSKTLTDERNRVVQKRLDASRFVEVIFLSKRTVVSHLSVPRNVLRSQRLQSRGHFSLVIFTTKISK